MKQLHFVMPCILVLAACAPEPLANYRPVVDPAFSSAKKYESDLASCQAIATNAQAEYTKRQNDQMAANMVVGLLLGAAIGGAYGSDYTGAGAAYGAASGMAATDTELAQGGPRRIIDRCMVERGHRVLNDLGRG